MLNPIIKISGIIFLLTITVVGLAQKTDKVSLKNGDTVTGEIKYMKFGMLKIDITGPGKIDIKWEEIVTIRSDKKLQITMRKGDVLITTLDSLFKNQNTSLDDLVEIVKIKDKFFQRLDGDFSLGFNYAKSNENAQFNFNSTTTYRKPKTEVTLKLNSALSHTSADTMLNRKQDATVDYYKKLKNRFYLNGLFGWQQNSQLGLRNRYLINGIGGKILFNDNEKRLLTGTGLSYNVEQSSKSNEFTSNVEALGIIQFKKFRYSSPKISLDAQYVIYPGISDWGRVRMDLQVDANIEIFKDFFVGLVFYDTYDNKPPTGAVSKNDFGINFTIGYTFGK